MDQLLLSSYIMFKRISHPVVCKLILEYILITISLKRDRGLIPFLVSTAVHCIVTSGLI